MQELIRTEQASKNSRYITMPTEQEVDEIYADAFAAGAAFIKEPQIASWGGYIVYFKDFSWIYLGRSFQSIYLDWTLG